MGELASYVLHRGEGGMVVLMMLLLSLRSQSTYLPTYRSIWKFLMPACSGISFKWAVFDESKPPTIKIKSNFSSISSVMASCLSWVASQMVSNSA